MRILISTLLAAATLFSCEFISDVTKEDDPGPSSVLYGISFFDSAMHFVKVKAKTGEFKTLSTLDGITGIRGQSTINAELGHYYFTANEIFVVVDIKVGSIVKSFEMQYPNTGNMQYNSSSKKINAISYFDKKMHFVEIDVENEKINVLGTLNTNGYIDGSSSIDVAIKSYYLVSFRTLYTVDLEEGTLKDSIQLPTNIGGLQTKKENVLFGLDFSSIDDYHFTTVDMETDEIKRLHSFEGNLTGHSSLDCKNGFYYYFSDNITLNCVNVKTGITTLSHKLPYNTNNLVPL